MLNLNSMINRNARKTILSADGLSAYSSKDILLYLPTHSKSFTNEKSLRTPKTNAILEYNTYMAVNN